MVILLQLTDSIVFKQNSSRNEKLRFILPPPQEEEAYIFHTVSSHTALLKFMTTNHTKLSFLWVCISARKSCMWEVLISSLQDFNISHGVPGAAEWTCIKIVYG